MKLSKNISAAFLAVMMVFTLVIGSGITAAAVVDPASATNLALGKDYSVFYLDASSAEVAVTATRGYSANLTDGNASVNAPVMLAPDYMTNDGAWFGLFHNAESPAQNCASNVGYVTVDLGDVYGLTEIKMNISNDTAEGTAPEKVRVFAKETAEEEYKLLGDLVAPTEAYGEAVLSGLAVNARYVKYEVTVANYWALFNEIIVMGGEKYENPVDNNNGNLALNKEYKTYYLDEEGNEQAVNMVSRGHGAKLTDGLASQTEPVYGEDGVTTGTWFGFFMNNQVPDEENCASGIGYIDLDLGAVYDLSEIKVNVSNVEGTAPGRIRVFASVTGSDEYLRIGDLSGATGEYCWTTLDASRFTAQYLRFEVTHEYHWAFLNEIEVYGDAASYIPASSENGALKAPYITYHIVDGTATDVNKISRNYSANLTDGVYDRDPAVIDAEMCNDGKWFGFFDNDLNETVAAIQNCPNGVGYVKLDLGEVYNITDIVVNTSIADGTKPGSIKAYASLTENGEYTEIGALTFGSGEGYADWASLQTTDAIQGQFVILEVALAEGAYWALFNEIMIYGSSRIASEGSNVALGSTVIVENPGSYTWHVTDLTDGVAVDKIIPGSNPEGWQDGESSGWHGFFSNSEVADNTEERVGTAIIDFDGKVTLNDILVHVYAVETIDFGGVMRPKRVSAYISDTLDGPYTYIGDCTLMEDAVKAYWAELNDINVTGSYLKIEVELADNAFWAMINEVEAFGIKHPKEEPPKVPEEIIVTETRLHGDINNDTIIDMKDYALLKRYCFGTYIIENDTIDFLVADIDNNDIIDMKDYGILKRSCFGTAVIDPEYVTFEKVISSTSVTIASFNIAHVNQYNFTNENYQILANDILASKADIVGIQEAVCGIFGASYGNPRFTDSLAKLKALTGYKYAYYLGWDDATNVAHGILSNYEITNLGEGTLIEASIESLTTGNDHYFSVTEFNTVDNYTISNAEGATLLEFDVNGKKVSFWNAHSKPANYATDLAILSGNEENFILVGDFNNPAYSDLTDFEVAEGVTLGSYMSLVNNEDNKLITFPRDQKFMDNIIYTTDDFILVDSGVVQGDVLASDHLLIWAKLAILD